MQFNPKWFQKSQQQLQREFSQLKYADRTLRERVSFACAERNRDRHRYSDVLSHDTHLFPPVGTGPYINASFISPEGFGSVHGFVAAQAPVSEYIHEFLSVLVRSRITLVLMLTREVERGMPKADPYWPDAVLSTKFFGPESVTLLRRAEDENGLLHRFLSIRLGSGETHEFHHIQYKDWPDFGVPRSVAPLLSLIETVRAKSQGDVIMVHCSAGIGRTGTLLSVYYALQLASNGLLREDTIFNIVLKLKEARIGMVQTIEQYEFIHSCVLRGLQGGPPVSES